MKGVSNALARLPIWWGRHSVQRAPLSTNGEQVGHYHPKFEGGKAVSAVVMPPQAHRELQGKQNKTKQNKANRGRMLICISKGDNTSFVLQSERPTRRRRF